MAASTSDQPALVPIVRRPGCRPHGCAGLCTDVGLARAYRTHRGQLLGRATMILGDAGLAEEAVQETFVRAWRGCVSFDPTGGPMIGWLNVILRNVSLDLIRARARRPAMVRSTPTDTAPAPSRPSDVDLMLLRAQLRDALAMIRPHHRTALVETILRDRSYDEVAAELGVPVGTVKSRVFYALRRMSGLVDPMDVAA